MSTCRPAVFSVITREASVAVLSLTVGVGRTALFRCGSVLTERQALTASRHIGGAWRDLARRLGFLGAETDDFEYRADSLKEVRMYIVYDSGTRRPQVHNV